MNARFEAMRAQWIASLVAGLLVTFFQVSARAETTVRWLHIEQNPQILETWTQIARDYEAQHPDVTIDMQFLENEAFKTKLTTLLQSEDRPHIFYSWGGGVLQAQIEAGVLRDVTDHMRGDWEAGLSPAAVNAFSYDGDVYGAPMLVSQVGFWYNKDLFAQAGLDADAIVEWDDLLAAVQTLKDAGITPIAAGGADKWPLHFYYTLLAIRLGGAEGFAAAMAGENGGFESDVYVRSGELYLQLTEMEPFQRGYLAAKYQEAAGVFGNGDAAMHLMGNWDYNTMKTNSVSGEGIPDDRLGWFDFPQIPDQAGRPTDTLGGINGWIFSAGAPDEAVDFMRVFLSQENQRMMGREGFFIPVAKGASSDIQNPFFKAVADNITASQYHQIFYDQMLGPDVGRVVNDVSQDLASGVVTPEEAAEQIQQAYEDANY